MNEPRDLIQRLKKKPNCPRVMAKPFPFTTSSRARSPRAISCVAGTFWLHRSVRPTMPFGIAIRTAIGSSIKMFRLGKAVRASSAKRLQTSLCCRSRPSGTDHDACASFVPGRIEWQLDLCSTLATRAMNLLMGSLMPDTLWKNPTVVGAMATVAGVALGAGKLRLTGRGPNGQRFIANPRSTWTVPSAKVTIDGRNLGAVAPLREQPKLGDFWIPRTGLLAIGRAFFDAFDLEIHSTATSRTESAAPESSTRFAAA